jgi:hypothetical protein
MRQVQVLRQASVACDWTSLTLSTPGVPPRQSGDIAVDNYKADRQ